MAPHVEPLPCQRALFDLPVDVAYLNCAYMSPLLRASAEQGQADLARKLHPWTIHPDDFFTGSDQLRTLAALLFGATADDVAIVPSVSYGISTAALNLPCARGQRILVLAEQFPSNEYPWRRLADDKGAIVDTVAWPEDGDWTAAVLAKLADDVAIAALPHTQWTSGGMLDLERIGAACRQHGTALVLDLTQSLGALAFDAQRVQPDFAVAACYKWLLGPYSLGVMYVAPKWQHGRPIEEGWIQRENSRDFTRLTDYTDTYDRGARRFDVGERSNFALVGAASKGMEQLLSWGVDRVSATSGALAAHLADRLAPHGIHALREPLRAPHYLCLRGKQPWPAELTKQLAEHHIHVSVRGSAVRVTPHVYNTIEEVDRLADVLLRTR